VVIDITKDDSAENHTIFSWDLKNNCAVFTSATGGAFLKPAVNAFRNPEEPNNAHWYKRGKTTIIITQGMSKKAVTDPPENRMVRTKPAPIAKTASK
jgi:hypothetical protein